MRRLILRNSAFEHKRRICSSRSDAIGQAARLWTCSFLSGHSPCCRGFLEGKPRHGNELQTGTIGRNGDAKSWSARHSVPGVFSSSGVTYGLFSHSAGQGRPGKHCPPAARTSRHGGPSFGPGRLPRIGSPHLPRRSIRISRPITRLYGPKAEMIGRPTELAEITKQ